MSAVAVVSQDARRSQLERILRSECFRNCENLRRLLSYLAERSLEQPAEDLKEYTIGIEVYGKPSSYDPQKDASVRVQVSRLRLKIDEYNKAEGAADPYRLELPKGRFAVLFQPRVSPGPAAEGEIDRAARKPVLSWIRLAVALVLVGSVSWTVVLWRRVDALASRLPAATAASAEFNTLWSGFSNPAISNTVVFGSPAFFASGSQHLFVRMYRLPNPDDPRSSPDFQEMDRRIGPLQGPRFDYTSMGDAIGVQRLTAFFGAHGVALHALPAHLASWETLQNSNLVFLGAARMNPLLRRLPIRQDFELGPDNFIHNHNPQPGEQAVYETPSHRDSMSYAVVGSFPGLTPERSTVLLVAHSSAGVLGAVDFVSGAEGLRVIRQKVGLRPGDHKHFQVLLRIFADSDAAVKTEYVTHHLNP